MNDGTAIWLLVKLCECMYVCMYVWDCLRGYRIWGMYMRQAYEWWKYYLACMCVCIYIYIYIYVYVYMDKHVCHFLHGHREHTEDTYIRMHACMHTYMHTYIHTYTFRFCPRIWHSKLTHKYIHTCTGSASWLPCSCERGQTLLLRFYLLPWIQLERQVCEYMCVCVSIYVCVYICMYASASSPWVFICTLEKHMFVLMCVGVFLHAGGYGSFLVYKTPFTACIVQCIVHRVRRV
jgi:hypothetical protein